jgi:hypothetical protein
MYQDLMRGAFDAPDLNDSEQINSGEFTPLPESAPEATIIQDSTFHFGARLISQRSMRAGVDSLDLRAGRVLPLAEADTTHVGHVRIVADTPLCEVPDAGGDVPDDAALVDRAALPAAVRDALDAEDIGASAQAQVRSR